MIRRFMICLAVVLEVFLPQPFAATYNSDGSDTDIQAIHDNAGTHAGDIITTPSGPFSWTTGISLTKGVHLQGLGSGRVVARSRDSVAFGTGSKSWTIQATGAGQPADNLISALPPGTVLRIWKIDTDKDSSYMLGTLTSLVGTTLTVNVTSSTGAGTPTLWLFATEDTTRVTHDAPGVLVDCTEDTAASIEISGIHFTGGSGDGQLIQFNYNTGGQPIMVHDCWLQGVSNKDIIHVLNTNRGLIWNVSVTWPFLATSNSQFLHFQCNSRTEVWANLSTFGTNDTTGKNQLYVEDSDFHGNLAAGVDIDSNSKIVWRYNVQDHFAFNSHGCDTSTFGTRQWEIYNNACYFANLGDFDGTKTLDFQYHYHLRGGTGVLLDNYMERITSTSWGPKSEVHLSVFCLGRFHPPYGPPYTYSANDGNTPQYPAPRQIFMGNVTGAGISAVDGQGFATRDGVTVGEPEPGYLDGNTGALNIEHGNDGANCPDPPADDASLYVVEGRDYFFTPKPGYTKYTYPHPLRGAAPPALGHTSFSGAGHSTNSGSGSTTIAQ